MPGAESSIKKLRSSSTLFPEILFVILAFFLMVISSCLYVNNMLQSDLQREAADKLTQTKFEIQAELAEPYSTLIAISRSIRRMILEGDSAETVQDYMKEISAEMRNKTFGFRYDGIYGYFEAFDGEFLHSEGWRGEENYEPTERPWYKAAMEAGNQVAVTTLYMNVHTNDYLVTFVHRLFDDENRPLGTVCLNARLDRIRDTVAAMRITEGGYGFLLDDALDIIAYPDQTLVGQNADAIGGAFSTLKNSIEAGNDIFEHEAESLAGRKEVLFSARLDNGWILFIATPKAEYYRKLYELRFYISILGTVLAGVLIFILVNVERAKNKTEEENRKQSVLLAEMEKMREADERTNVMLNEAPLGVNIWDKNANIIDCNRETLRLFGLNDKREYLDRFFDFSPEYQPSGELSREKALYYIERTLERGYCHSEWMHKNLSGEEIPTEITLIRVKYRGEYEVAVYIRDLRELKAMLGEIHKAEEDLRQARDIAEESNKAKSRFLATMSHEIRTPMNVILGVTEGHLQTENLQPEIKEAFEKIYNAGDLLIHIINDILDLSKIEAGKFELSPVRYEVASLINDAAQLNVAKFEHKPIEFSLNVDENIPSHLFGDELRIKQILNNLLSNALKYTDSGEVGLSFAVSDTEPKHEDRVMLIFSVKDTGQGMTKEQVEKLFDEYSRFNLSANRTTVGTGLGMTITRNLIKMMNGEIFVESEPDLGSTFTVRIPQGKTTLGVLGKEASENFRQFHFNSLAQKKNKKITREPMPYGKVLVVDDMKTNLDVAKLLLTPYKLEVSSAESGFAAIDLIKNGNEYDIVFMDHMMPKMDGIEAVKNIRELGYKKTIIALTANAVVGQKAVFLSKGFNGYISKPIDIRQLNEILNKFIRDKQDSKTIDAARKQKDGAGISGAKYAPGTQEGMSIPGLDAEIGLANCDGDMEIYVSILRSYVPNAREVAANLRAAKLRAAESQRQISSDAARAEALADYAISVHGLKGISGTIGAKKVWEAALNLETLAKAGKLDEVLAANGALIADTETLAGAVEKYLEELDHGGQKAPLSSPARELLVKLQKYCEDYDMDGADAVLEELEESGYAGDASFIARLRETIDALNFNLAAERLAAYLRETE